MNRIQLAATSSLQILQPANLYLQAGSSDVPMCQPYLFCLLIHSIDLLISIRENYLGLAVDYWILVSKWSWNLCGPIPKAARHCALKNGWRSCKSSIMRTQERGYCSLLSCRIWILCLARLFAWEKTPIQRMCETCYIWRLWYEFIFLWDYKIIELQSSNVLNLSILQSFFYFQRLGMDMNLHFIMACQIKGQSFGRDYT